METHRKLTAGGATIMPPYIVVVEDDHLEEGPLGEYLAGAFEGADVLTMATECEFRESLPRLRTRVPDLVVMDVMLRWSSPSPHPVDPPADVVRSGYYRAGLRCARLLADDEQLRAVPVILYTILERSDLERDGETLPANSVYVSKSADLESLRRRIRAVLERRTRPAAGGRPSGR
jgi:CheY-like chemotaxis protein